MTERNHIQKPRLYTFKLIIRLQNGRDHQVYWILNFDFHLNYHWKKKDKQTNSWPSLLDSCSCNTMERDGSRHIINGLEEFQRESESQSLIWVLQSFICQQCFRNNETIIIFQHWQVLQGEEDVTDNHTRFTVTAPMEAVFHSVMTILTFLIWTEWVRYYRVTFYIKSLAAMFFIAVILIFPLARLSYLKYCLWACRN